MYIFRSCDLNQVIFVLFSVHDYFQVTTVDKFQGQQNDFILLSLVRTRFVGHLRDVRRLVVAMSRARLGLYVFCRRSLFEQCYELQPTFQLLLKRPDHLALNVNEITSYTKRNVEDPGPRHHIHLVSGIEEMGIIIERLHQVCLTSLDTRHHIIYRYNMTNKGKCRTSKIIGQPHL